MTTHEIETLSRYNGERARGILHTHEWDEDMRTLQATFNTEHYPDDECFTCSRKFREHEKACGLKRWMTP